MKLFYTIFFLTSLKLMAVESYQIEELIHVDKEKCKITEQDLKNKNLIWDQMESQTILQSQNFVSQLIYNSLKDSFFKMEQFNNTLFSDTLLYLEANELTFSCIKNFDQIYAEDSDDSIAYYLFQNRNIILTQNIMAKIILLYKTILLNKNIPEYKLFGKSKNISISSFSEIKNNFPELLSDIQKTIIHEFLHHLNLDNYEIKLHNREKKYFTSEKEELNLLLTDHIYACSYVFSESKYLLEGLKNTFNKYYPRKETSLKKLDKYLRKICLKAQVNNKKFSKNIENISLDSILQDKEINTQLEEKKQIIDSNYIDIKFWKIKQNFINLTINNKKDFNNCSLNKVKNSDGIFYSLPLSCIVQNIKEYKNPETLLSHLNQLSPKIKLFEFEKEFPITINKMTINHEVEQNLIKHFLMNNSYQIKNLLDIISENAFINNTSEEIEFNRNIKQVKNLCNTCKNHNELIKKMNEFELQKDNKEIKWLSQNIYVQFTVRDITLKNYLNQIPGFEMTQNKMTLKNLFIKYFNGNIYKITSDQLEKFRKNSYPNLVVIENNQPKLFSLY